MNNNYRFFSISVICIAIQSFSTISAAATFWDCLWGGSNEETKYTPPYVQAVEGNRLAQVAAPSMNLGAPQPQIPVQAGPGTQAVSVPQANIPTISVPTGPVGSVGMPATHPTTFPTTTGLPQAPPGTEIVYVIPANAPTEKECIDGTPGTPARASKVVPPGTPGAIPVAVRNVTVRRPKVERSLSYSPIRTKTEKLVKVVDRRTGRVVRTYCDNDEEKSMLPWPHIKEVVTYETVTVKVGTPVSLGPTTSTAGNSVIHGTGPDPTVYQSRYVDWNSPPTVEGGSQRTLIVP